MSETDGGSSTRDSKISGNAPGGSRSSPVIKLIVLAAVIGAFVYIYAEHRDELTLESVAGHEAQFRQFGQEHPVAILALAFLIYVAITGLSIPGAAVLTLSYGWFFGFWPALVLVSFASTAGATVAFLLSRYLLRDTIQRRFGERLKKFDQALEKDGPFYLFQLRLIPAVPFFIINVVMGLTPIRVRTYWWVSQLGMLAGTVVYVYAGSTIPSADELANPDELSGVLKWEFIMAFVILGMFPLIVKKLMARFQPQTSESHS